LTSFQAQAQAWRTSYFGTPLLGNSGAGGGNPRGEIAEQAKVGNGKGIKKKEKKVNQGKKKEAGGTDYGLSFQAAAAAAAWAAGPLGGTLPLRPPPPPSAPIPDSERNGETQENGNIDTSSSSSSPVSNELAPSVLALEAEYWQMVEGVSPRLKKLKKQKQDGGGAGAHDDESEDDAEALKLIKRVAYGSDLDSSVVGSGFPTAASATMTMATTSTAASSLSSSLRTNAPSSATTLQLIQSPPPPPPSGKFQETCCAAFKVGDWVEARWRGKSRWWPGTIYTVTSKQLTTATASGPTTHSFAKLKHRSPKKNKAGSPFVYGINYDDGEVEANVAHKLVRPVSFAASPSTQISTKSPKLTAAVPAAAVKRERSKVVDSNGGSFTQPKGRPRKGMQWNTHTGSWVQPADSSSSSSQPHPPHLASPSSTTSASWSSSQTTCCWVCAECTLENTLKRKKCAACSSKRLRINQDQEEQGDHLAAEEAVTNAAAATVAETSACFSSSSFTHHDYTSSPWNLNQLPTVKGSLLRLLDADITGVVKPWLYVGSLFSSFCWHNEDHHL
jgi:hypothetical protein